MADTPDTTETTGSDESTDTTDSADTRDNDGDRPADRPAAKRSSSPRASARARKAPTKKAPAKKSAAPERPGGEGSEEHGSRPRVRTADLALAAAEQLVALTGKPFEGIVGLRRSDDGWDVDIEVLEMRRIPSTTDVIAVYRVAVDAQGDLLDYRRLHRYLRGQAGEER
jgi:hypothetical protein